MDLEKKLCEMVQFTEGCTEPAAIALNAAWAASYLKNAERFTLTIDRMTLKNAFRAGIPNSNNHIGPIYALLFGYLLANPQDGLELFHRLDDATVKQAERMREKVKIIPTDKPELFIETKAESATGWVRVQTVGEHTHIAVIETNEGTKRTQSATVTATVEFERELYDVSLWSALVDELYARKRLRDRIASAIETNRDALKKAAFYREEPIYSAVYARMKGDPIRVASCAGSGNKGLVALLTPLVYGPKADTEKQTKACILSCLVTSLITSRCGFVSSICGVVHAAASGAMAGILYLKEKLDLFDGAFNNYIASVAGVVCDGAKKSCAMKATNAINAMLSSMDSALRGNFVDSMDGFLGRNFLETMDNLCRYKKSFSRLDPITIEILSKKMG